MNMIFWFLIIHFNEPLLNTNDIFLTISLNPNINHFNKVCLKAKRNKLPDEISIMSPNYPEAVKDRRHYI